MNQISLSSLQSFFQSLTSPSIIYTEKTIQLCHVPVVRTLQNLLRTKKHGVFCCSLSCRGWKNKLSESLTEALFVESIAKPTHLPGLFYFMFLLIYDPVDMTRWNRKTLKSTVDKETQLSLFKAYINVKAKSSRI